MAQRPSSDHSQHGLLTLKPAFLRHRSFHVRDRKSIHFLDFSWDPLFPRPPNQDSADVFKSPLARFQLQNSLNVKKKFWHAIISFNSFVYVWDHNSICQMLL